MVGYHNNVPTILVYNYSSFFLPKIEHALQSSTLMIILVSGDKQLLWAALFQLRVRVASYIYMLLLVVVI